MIRLKDVAARAGVSLMTVSKVLRDAPDVSQATKARIRRLAQEMGYVPDALARGLRTRQTRLLGLVVPGIEHSWVSEAVSVMQDRVHELGFDLLLAQTDENVQREEISIRRLLSRHVDGIFLFPVYRLAPVSAIYQELERSRTPTVLLGHRAPFCATFPAVETDDLSASYRVTQHLLKLGHRRIAFVTGPSSAPWAQERFEGYRRALRDSQIGLEDRLVFTGGTTLADGEKAGTQLLGELTGATAIQVVSDLVAVGIARAITQNGLRIPDDIALAGFGNHPLGEHGRVPLTSVQLPRQEIGWAAVDVMQRLWRGEIPETQRLLGELVIRASTARPAPHEEHEALVGPAPVPTLDSEDDLQ